MGAVTVNRNRTPCPQISMNQRLGGPFPLLARIGSSANNSVCDERTDLLRMGERRWQERLFRMITDPEPPVFHDNIVAGAKACAEYIWGPGAKPQKFYDLIRRSNFPWFKFGKTLAIRKSVVDAYLAHQEHRNMIRFTANENAPPHANDDDDGEGEASA